jgi:fatty acid synthase
VYFDEASQQIPHNAIAIEIAPRGILQAILKRSLKEGITNIALTQRGHLDGAEFLLTALGKYVSGLVYLMSYILYVLYGEINTRGTV